MQKNPTIETLAELNPVARMVCARALVDHQVWYCLTVQVSLARNLIRAWWLLDGSELHYHQQVPYRPQRMLDRMIMAPPLDDWIPVD